MIIDNFLSSYDLLEETALKAKFLDKTNPIDGVVYPGIATDIPEKVKLEIIQRLAIFKGEPIEDETMFMRLSMSDTPFPHQAHHDFVMGKWSLMLYLNEPAHDRGTSFLVHKETGITYAPENEEYNKILRTDQNDAEKWEIIEFIPMAKNRALIFDARRLHRAEPMGGFGDSVENGRIVLTCFFS